MKSQRDLILDQQRQASEALRLNPNDRELRLWLADWVMEEVLEVYMDQITIKRPHPGWRPPVTSRHRDGHRNAVSGLLAVLPVTLSAEVEARGYYPYPCTCPVIYRLTPDAVRWLDSRELLRKGLSVERRPCICGCMI